MRLTAEQAAAVAVTALDSPYLFNARWHQEREDTRPEATILAFVREVVQLDPPLTREELRECVALEVARRAKEKL